MKTAIPPNQARFSASEILSISGGSPEGRLPEDVRGICTDSRAAVDGCLFVALRGENHDGHRYVDRAFGAGARLAVVDSQSAVGAEDGPIVRVPSTLDALGELALAHRRRWGKKVVTVTGSVGKTATKELAAAALTGVGLNVLKTTGNLNNRIGLPMTLLSLDDRHEIAVLEAGMNLPGEISTLGRIAQPDVGVVTGVELVHAEGVGGLREIAKEKYSLFASIRQGGVEIVYGDCPWAAEHQEDEGSRTRMTFGRSDRADVVLVGWELQDNWTMRVNLQADDQQLSGSIRMLGEGSARACAAAICIAKALGLDLKRAMDALHACAPPRGRLQLAAGHGGAWIVDDSYNASPPSVKNAVALSSAIAHKHGRHFVAVLGDMLELGRFSASEHDEILDALASSNVRFLIACGPEMGAAVSRNAAWTGRARICRDAEEAAAALLQSLKPADLVLIKGSRGVGLDHVAAAVSLKEAP